MVAGIILKVVYDAVVKSLDFLHAGVGQEGIRPDEI